jgi:nucleoside-diphosphate-sugar epimerase
MRILVLGATGLSGTAITLAALERGHEVVAVHRGTTDTLHEVSDPNLLVDYVHDRRAGHHALAARGPFDAIVDVSARLPAWVADAVRTLDAGEPHWVQLSSVSAYADLSRPGPQEADAVAAFDDPMIELAACTDPAAQVGMEHYGPLKAACERMLLEAPGRVNRCTVLRPVLITGAHDATWRVPWWVRRIAEGGTAVAPPAEDPIQVIDVRDLAGLALDAAEQGIAGVYNAAPAPGSQTVGSLVQACREAVGTAGGEPAHVVHAPRAVLAEHGAEPWSDLPAWLPDDLDLRGMVTARTELVEEVFGFRSRPLVETMAHVLAWIASGTAGEPTRTGLAAEVERRVLAAC